MKLPPIAVLASVVGMAIAHGSSELCDSFKENRYITTEEAQEQLGPWFEGEFNEWESSHKDEQPRFWSWFHQKYSPGSTDSILDCKLDGPCSVS